MFSEAGDKSHGYLPYAKSWYRKHFKMDAANKDKHIYLDFDGVMVQSQVYLNGKLLGGHDSGYTPFRFTLKNSDLVFGGGDNVLAVFVDATKPDGWWYDGGGIYRHVRLTAVDPLHVLPYGIYAPSHVTSTITATSSTAASADATLNCTVDLANFATTEVTFTVTNTVVDVNSRVVVSKTSDAMKLAAGANTTYACGGLAMAQATLWSIEDPHLYTLVTSISLPTTSHQPIVDTVNTTFGVRKAVFTADKGMYYTHIIHYTHIMVFTADKGFFLNDKSVKIKGTCQHQDFAGVGEV
jgi:beta-galactosidase